MITAVIRRESRGMSRSAPSGARAVSSPPVSGAVKVLKPFCVVAVEHKDLRSSWN